MWNASDEEAVHLPVVFMKNRLFFSKISITKDRVEMWFDVEIGSCKVEFMENNVPIYRM